MQVWDERVDQKIAAKVPITAKAAASAGAAVRSRRGINLVGLLGDLVVWGVLTLSVLILALAILARTGAQSGTQWLVVVSNSMWPALKTGDLVAVRPVTAPQLQVGDIITYEDSRDRNVLVTHRIVARDLAAGTAVFQVKGDNNPVVDPELVRAAQVVGRVAFHLPLAGYVIHAFQARPIFVLVALMPSILLLGLQATRRLSNAGVRSP
ncbi:MAG: signal peptidase I [Symbiobacteriia bacterium]